MYIFIPISLGSLVDTEVRSCTALNQKLILNFCTLHAVVEYNG